MSTADALIRRGRINNYVVAKRIAKTAFYLANRPGIREANPPLLIYQMGKVGSSSLYESLKAQWKASPTYHVHVLSKENLGNLDNVIRASYPNTHHIPEHLLAGEFLRRFVPKGATPHPWPLITVVRDPIARNISSFFQDLTTRHAYLDYPAASTQADTQKEVERLSATFLTNHDHHRPLRWFDMELKRVFGIDIFSAPFSMDKGYNIYANDRCRVLLLKLETLDRCVTEAMREFLGLQQFGLLNSNISDQKDYGQLYDAVRKSIRIPNSLIDAMYESRLVRHLYTTDEIHRFRSKWNRSG